MNIKQIKVGELRTNCYLVSNDNNCILVDPGSDLKEDIKKINLEIKDKKLLAIIFTHNHFDHIGGAHVFNAPHYMHKEDINNMEEFAKKSEYIIHRKIITPKNINPIGEEMKFENISFKVIHTPGHSKGGVCLLFDKYIITGDTLFFETYGRTDLPGSDSKEMRNSLKKIAELNQDLIIYPGHGKPSTIEHEKIWIDKL